MKTKATSFLKQVVSVVVSVVKARTVAVKSKTGAIRTRLAILGILRSKKVLMSSISHKLHALVGTQQSREELQDTSCKAIVLYNAANVAPPPHPDIAVDYKVVVSSCDNDDDDDQYPDLRHCLFDTDYELDDDDDEDVGGDCGGAGSAIDFVRNSRQLQEEGSSSSSSGFFSLEDEIDHVADVFIRRFHKHMRLEKKESFKRYKEMLERSV